MTKVVRGSGAMVAVAAIALLIHPQPSEAQQIPEQDILAATETTHLAFVRTGVPQVDATSKAGLYGLTFGEIDFRNLPLDLAAHDHGVVRDHRPDAL